MKKLNWYLQYYKVKFCNKVKIKNKKAVRYYLPNIRVANTIYPTSNWLELNQKERFDIIGEQLIKNNVRLQ